MICAYRFKKVGVNGIVLREIRRALDKEPEFLEHMMERPLELLRTLRLTASLRTLLSLNTEYTSILEIEYHYF